MKPQLNSARPLRRQGAVIAAIATAMVSFSSVYAQIVVAEKEDTLQEGDRLMATWATRGLFSEGFAIRCPIGSQLGGFDLSMREGEGENDGIVLPIAVICITALAPAVAGPEAHGWKYWREQSLLGDLAWSGPARPKLRCPSETPIVTKIRVEALEHGSYGGYSVEGVELYCGLAASTPSQHVAGPAYRRYTGMPIWGNSRCADGLVAVGVTGRSTGPPLSSLGLICGEPVVTPGAGPTVKAQARVKLAPSSSALSSHWTRPICDIAKQARDRNSPAAPGLEAQCAAFVKLPLADHDDLIAKGEAIARQDPLAVELLDQQPDNSARIGFDIGMVVAEKDAGHGPGKQRIHDSLPAEEQSGFRAAVDFLVERNRHGDLAATGAAIARADPVVAAARDASADVFYRLGFDIASAFFGDPALGGLGNTGTGPGSLGVRDTLSVAGQDGFNAAADFHLKRRN